MKRGKIAVWKTTAKGGYGYIVCDGLKYFVHVRDIVSGTPETGAIVTFEPAGPDPGRGPLPRALKVVVIDPVRSILAGK